MIDEKVLYIGDRSSWSYSAANFLRNHFQDVQTIFWRYGEPVPTKHQGWVGEHIFTFKAPLMKDGGTRFIHAPC